MTRRRHACVGLFRAVAAGLLLATAWAYAAHKPESWARSQFASAERLREALDRHAPAERTRRDYQRVIDAYRRVYYGSPTSTKADPSAAAVAQLLLEEGRRFEDRKLLRSAIGQYEFLRREYPGSRYRFEALYTTAEIYRDDLDEPAKARPVLEEFLRRYPGHNLADGARKALGSLEVSSSRPKSKSQDRDKDHDKNPATDEVASRDTGSHETISAAKDNPPSTKTAASAHADASDPGSSEGDDSPRGSARITGIRHWSTPDYTRIAIDMDQDVDYKAERIDHPSRIFFDLSGARLAAALNGRTFDVEDGFLKKIRAAQFQPDRARVVLEVDERADYDASFEPNPPRLIIDIRREHAASLAGTPDQIAPTSASNRSLASHSRSAATPVPVTAVDDPNDDTVPPSASASRKGAALKKTAAVSTAAKAGPPRKIVEADDSDDESTAKLDPPSLPAAKVSSSGADRRPAENSKTRGKSKKKAAVSDIETREARPTAAGDRSLIRALGLKIGKIVIDPGHGGHDTGTIGPKGLLEKDVVLDVANRLGKLLVTRLGAEVIYTRDDDTFIPLETRTAIANREQADLFVSIHANSSSDSDARGVETYYLNFTSSPEALEVAARENAVSDKSIHELQDLVKKIALKEKIEESREFAGDVQHSLHSGLVVKSPGIRDRGVKKAPFIVLIGANMPSILAEISFVSNPTDERNLQVGDYRQRIADSLYRGIAKYVSGLSGVKVASRIEKDSGQ